MVFCSSLFLNLKITSLLTEIPLLVLVPEPNLKNTSLYFSSQRTGCSKRSTNSTTSASWKKNVFFSSCSPFGVAKAQWSVWLVWHQFYTRCPSWCNWDFEPGTSNMGGDSATTKPAERKTKKPSFNTSVVEAAVPVYEVITSILSISLCNFSYWGYYWGNYLCAFTSCTLGTTK